MEDLLVVLHIIGDKPKKQTMPAHEAAQLVIAWVECRLEYEMDDGYLISFDNVHKIDLNVNGAE